MTTEHPNRREFLRRTSLALAGGLLVGDAALEMFERLTHRKVWALGGLPSRSLDSLPGSTYEVWERLRDGKYSKRIEHWGSVVWYPDTEPTAFTPPLAIGETLRIKRKTA